MSSIIKSREPARQAGGVAFNFGDMTEKAQAYLATVQGEARKIIAEAEQQAAGIRERAEREGRAAAMAQMEQTAQQKVSTHVATLLPALKQVVEQIGHARQAWIKHWEQQAIHVAAAIAERVIRKELARDPEITLALIREALELAAGSADVKVYLHPEDQQALGRQAQLLIRELSRAGAAEVIAADDIGRGGCRVETRFGVIDQQIETQLARIEEELS